MLNYTRLQRGIIPWLSTICRAHNKLTPYTPEAVYVPHLTPWAPLPYQIITNDHLPAKHTLDSSVLYNLTVASMTDIIQPRDHIYYTDGSVSEWRVSAAFTYMGHPTLIKLSDTCSIMQAELIVIHASLQHGVQSPSRCVVFSDAKSALQAFSSIALVTIYIYCGKSGTSHQVYQSRPSSPGFPVILVLRETKLQTEQRDRP